MHGETVAAACRMLACYPGPGLSDNVATKFYLATISKMALCEAAAAAAAAPAAAFTFKGTANPLA